LQRKGLETAQGRRIPSVRPAYRNHCRDKVEQIIKSIDEDQPVHRVAEVFGKTKSQDNRRDTEDGQRRGASANLGYGVGLLIGEDHIEYRVFSHGPELNDFLSSISLYKTMTERAI
jgi:hypothetical protein